jgi:hypothetical protein
MTLSERGEAIVTPIWKKPEERWSKIRTRWIPEVNGTEETKGNYQKGNMKRLWEAARLGQLSINENTTNDWGGGSRSSTNIARQLVRSADAKKNEVKKGIPKEWGN